MKVFIVAILKLNLERISRPKIYMRIKENYIPPCRADPLARVHMGNFHHTLVGSRQNQVRSHFIVLSFSHINTLCFYRSFLKKVRFSLGEPIHLTGMAYLHMNSSLFSEDLLVFSYPQITDLRFT